MARHQPKRDEGMYYVAKHTIQVAKDDIRGVGAPVPEAFDWKRTPSFVKTGWLTFIPSKPPSPPSAPNINATAKQEEPVSPRAETGPNTPAQDPGLGASVESAETSPSALLQEAPKSGADPKAKPSAPQHGKPKGAPK